LTKIGFEIIFQLVLFTGENMEEKDKIIFEGLVGSKEVFQKKFCHPETLSAEGMEQWPRTPTHPETYFLSLICKTPECGKNYCLILEDSNRPVEIREIESPVEINGLILERYPELAIEIAVREAIRQGKFIQRIKKL
jgi:hypothetical protein